MRKLLQVVAGIAVLWVAGFSRPGRAQLVTAQGFALDRFESSERGSEWFELDNLDMRGNFRLSVGMVGDWAHEPLMVKNLQGQNQQDFLTTQFIGQAGLSIAILDSLRLGFNLPLVFVNNGATTTTADGLFQFIAPAQSGFSVGDLRVGLDVRLLGHYGRPFSLALGGQVFFPTGKADNYTSDRIADRNGYRYTVHLLAAGDLGVFSYAAKAGLYYRGNAFTYDGYLFGTEFQYGLAAGLHLFNKNFMIGPEVWGAVVIQSVSSLKKNNPLEGTFGAHLTLADHIRIGAGFGPGLVFSAGTPQYRGLASLEYVSGPPAPPPDRDNDGIPDLEDACPDIAGPATDNPKTNGCPPDRDNDGIPDATDACPDTPGIFTNDPKTNGCPPDRDGDGIPDAVDACPDVRGVATTDPKTNGCPPDRDHDGIADDLDACPDVPGVASDDPKKNGCPAPLVPPPPPDRDHDGIPDAVDACPDEPGSPNKDPKMNGCPRVRVDIKTKLVVITQQIEFVNGKAVFVPGSDGLLQEITDVLKAHPEIIKVRVEGYTDNRGSAKLNVKLSRARAAAVVKWMDDHGIDPKRLISEGFGSQRAIAPNKTAEGRQKNRRVEFHILELAPTPAPVPASAVVPLENLPPPPPPETPAL
jgi:OmpA-OmpF porin, OOP family